MLVQSRIASAVDHLCTADPVMREIIYEVGPFTLRPERNRFRLLVRSIISQQISTGAARSIRRRLDELAAPDGLTSANLIRLSPEELRAAGVSPQKARYILDLSAKVENGQVNLRQMGRYSDERVIEKLTQVKGIGRWTAQMFLIFALGRLDVFPHDDLGVRAAIKARYGLVEIPDSQTGSEIAAKWRPYASVGSWYCWRSLDVGKNGNAFAKGYPA